MFPSPSSLQEPFIPDHLCLFMNQVVEISHCPSKCDHVRWRQSLQKLQWLNLSIAVAGRTQCCCCCWRDVREFPNHTCWAVVRRVPVIEQLKINRQQLLSVSEQQQHGGVHWGNEHCRPRSRDGCAVIAALVKECPGFVEGTASPHGTENIKL